MKKPLVIALSGINASDNPGPGVPIARSLKESSPDYTLIGLSYDVHDSGNYLDLLFKTTSRLPFPSKGWKSLFNRLFEIHVKEKLNILIPSLDAELPLYIRHQANLAENGIQTFLPTEHQFQIRNKDRLAETCKEFHLHHPKTVPVSSVDELIRVIQDQVELPCMIKGNFYKAYLVHSAQQAVLKFHEIAEEWGLPILVQEVISGKEINLIGLGDGLGGSCGMVAIKKLSTTQLGKILTGVTISHPKLIDYGRAFIQKTSWRGPFELECIERDGEIFLIEINPRFPAWVYFATAVGLNLPQRMIDLILQGDCDRTHEYEAGKLFIRYSHELVTDLTRYSQLIME